MNLSGQQLESLHDAILDGFSKQDLAQLLRFKLNERLEVISDGDNLSETVFALIRWAESRGRLAELIREANLARPHQPTLAQFTTTLDQAAEAKPTVPDETPTTPNPNPQPEEQPERSLKRVVGWGITAIGLIASVITIVAYCQPPTPPGSPTPEATAATPTTVAEPTEFAYTVTVIDDDTDLPIANAQVTIEIGGKAPLTEYADSNGFARVVVPATFTKQAGRLIVNADGYRVNRQEIDLYPERLPDTVRLKRE